MPNHVLNLMIKLWQHATRVSGSAYIVIIVLMCLIAVILIAYGNNKKHIITKIIIGCVSFVVCIGMFLYTSEIHHYDQYEVVAFTKIKKNRETSNLIPDEKARMKKDNNIVIQYRKHHYKSLAKEKQARHARKRYYALNDIIRTRQKFNQKHNHPKYPHWYDKL